MRPAVSRAASRAAAIAADQQEAARSNLGPLARVARVSHPDFEEAIEADELPTVTALAERGKHHISMTGRASRDRQESTPPGASPRAPERRALADYSRWRDYDGANGFELYSNSSRQSPGPH